MELIQVCENKLVDACSELRPPIASAKTSWSTLVNVTRLLSGLRKTQQSYLEILGGLKSVDDKRSRNILIMILHPISHPGPMTQEQDLTHPALSSVRASSLPDTFKPKRVQS